MDARGSGAFPAFLTLWGRSGSNPVCLPGTALQASAHFPHSKLNPASDEDTHKLLLEQAPGQV